MDYVVKSTGDKQIFSSEKIKKSLLEAGASMDVAEEIVRKISRKKYNHISTHKILQIALRNLRKYKGVSARYNLKKAIMEMGPAGYSFEKYFALVLRGNGYEAKKGGLYKGKVIKHEIDVFAKKDNVKFMVECKYHNQRGVHTRVKVPLYVYARFLDLKKYFDVPWIATNTKCTRDALEYAKGVNMKVTSWDYPSNQGLKDLIDNKRLYPITVLNTISHKTKQNLFRENIFLVERFVENDFQELLHKTHLPKGQLSNVIKEATEIMNS